METKASTTIRKSAQEVAEFWQRPGNVPGYLSEAEVEFRPAPGDRGTELHVLLRYGIPGGKLGGLAARLAGEDPRQWLDDDLRRIKQVLETGEVVRSEGAPLGKRTRKEFPQRPARPLSEAELAELAEAEQAENAEAEGARA